MKRKDIRIMGQKISELFNSVSRLKIMSHSVLIPDIKKDLITTTSDLLTSTTEINNLIAKISINKSSRKKQK